MSIKKDLANKLKQMHPERLKMVLGFDGFIDEIVHAVDKWLDDQTFKRIDTIESFAKRIGNASGLSTNIEFYPVQKKLGGNGPIMCNALAQHNPEITYIGALGNPHIDEIFLSIPKHVHMITLAESGHTDALEFNDGKIMLGKMKFLKEVTYERLIEVVTEPRLIEYLNDADLFASVNWSMLPNMSELWLKIAQHILPKLDARETRPIFFVDLADPEKRTGYEIKHALELLKLYQTHFFVLLGLNHKEAFELAKTLELIDESLTIKELPLDQLNQVLYQALGLDGVVIHPVDRSSIVIDGKLYTDLGPYVKEPKLTTGAGDNFNSGTVLGLLLGLNPHEALLTGMATSGYYVRNAKSPSFDELIHFIELWDQGLV